MISNALSGFIYDRYGNRELYLLGAILCVISLILALNAGKLEPIVGQTYTTQSNEEAG